MRRLFGYARRHIGRIIWGCLMLLLTNAAALALPQLFRLAVDGIHEGAPSGLLRDLALTMVLVAAAGAVVRTLSRIHLFYAARDVELALRCDFYTHLTRQPPSFFESHPSGDLMSRATNDLTQVRLLLGPGILNIFNTLVAYAAGLPLMLQISVELTLLGLIVYPPTLVLVFRLSRALYRRNREQQEKLGELSSFIQEALAGNAVVRAFGMERSQLERFGQGNEAYYRSNVRLAWIRSSMWNVIGTLAAIGTLITLYVGARRVIEGEISAGQLVALVEYMAILAWPSFALGWVISLWQRGTASMARLEQIMAIEPAILPGKEKPAGLEPSLSVRHLSIELDGKRVLDGVSFDSAAGATLGIVGPIGSGKSVLVRALVRHIEAPRDSIFVGGKDVVDLDQGALHAAFGFVHQNPVLFSKSVSDNVAFGRPGAGEAAIREALATAAFESELGVLPHGLATQIGERGITLSGGQKQRVAIARALLLAPPILVLDDALSSVDAETEATILEALRKLRQGASTIIVAHRITAVRHADRIIVLDGGRIVAQGDHQSLIGAGGLYAQLARRQELERDLSSERRSA